MTVASKPSPTLALAGLSLLVFPRAAKTIAYAALGLYGLQLFQVYKAKGSAAVIDIAKADLTTAKDQITALQTQEAQMVAEQVSSSPSLFSGMC